MNLKEIEWEGVETGNFLTSWATVSLLLCVSTRWYWILWCWSCDWTVLVL